MNRKYHKYIEYIVNDIQAPYFKNMVDMYGLSPDEYESVLSKIFNQPVTIIGRTDVYNKQDRIIYYENSTGYWKKWKYDAQGNITYLELSEGFWVKYEYDKKGNMTYLENSNGNIIDNR
jgi:YD repeat-containing protein